MPENAAQVIAAEAIAAQVQAVVRGEPDAWHKFMAELAPAVASMATRNPQLRSRRQTSPDDVAEIVTATFERLHRDNFRNLRHFLQQAENREAERTLTFDSWLYGAVNYVVGDYLRQRYGRRPAADAPPDQRRPSKRDLDSLAARIPTGMDLPAGRQGRGVTTQMTVAELLKLVADEFAPPEVRAFQLRFFEDRSFAEIAEALGMNDAQEVERLIRRINARLRYRLARDP